MNKSTKHLYIHIPFCKYICTYCDFVRKIPKNTFEVESYINDLINKINRIQNKFKTIYIGGGTPNFLSDSLLNKLLLSLQKNICCNTEFTIECNPDFVTESQIKIFKLNNINRISLGVQTTNNNILKLLNRKHSIQDAVDAIKILKKFGINNISCDFIYNLPLLKKSDLDAAIDFCLNNNINHISFYSLEIKENSILKKMKYIINTDEEEKQLEYIIKQLKKTKFKRYEVSNWSIAKKYRSNHNLAYWNLKDWMAIGIGAYGLENKNYYTNIGSYQNYKVKNNILDDKEYYLYILMMGLRLTDGINLNSRNKKAYEFYKNQINKSMIKIKNNKLILKNINLLDSLLINLI